MNAEIERLLKLGRMDLEAGYAKYARTYFEKVLALDPSNREAAEALARIDIMLNRSKPSVAPKAQARPVVTAGVPVAPQPDTVYCAKCGAENKATYRYCIKCAEPLITPASPSSRQRGARIPSVDVPSTLATRAQERESVVGSAKAKLAGTRLSALGALVILVAFFLPWVRACGAPMSGWQLATDPTIQGKEQFYLTPMAAVLALLFIGWAMSRSAVVRGQVGRIVFLLATVSVLPALDLLYSAYTRGRSVLEPMYGLWLALTGCGALVGGAAMDIQAGAARTKPASPVCSRCGAENPPANRYCQECGTALPGVEVESAGLRIWHVVLAGLAGLLGLLLLLGASQLAADPQAQMIPGSPQGLGGELVLLALVLGTGILLSFVLYRGKGK